MSRSTVSSYKHFGFNRPLIKDATVLQHPSRMAMVLDSLETSLLVLDIHILNVVYHVTQRRYEICLFEFGIINQISQF